jgi:hypothetical protein
MQNKKEEFNKDRIFEKIQLRTHLAGKTTEKTQNFDPSTPPAGAEHL